MLVAIEHASQYIVGAEGYSVGKYTVPKDCMCSDTVSVDTMCADRKDSVYK